MLNKQYIMKTPHFTTWYMNRCIGKIVHKNTGLQPNAKFKRRKTSNTQIFVTKRTDISHEN